MSSGVLDKYFTKMKNKYTDECPSYKYLNNKPIIP